MGRVREVRRIHRWKPGEYPGDPDSDDPNVEYTTIGKLAEEDEKRAPKFPLWTPRPGPESGISCQNCDGPTFIVDEKDAGEMLTPIGYSPGDGTAPREKILALACPRCDRVVMQIRASALPRRL